MVASERHLDWQRTPKKAGSSSFLSADVNKKSALFKGQIHKR